jgi:5'-3' exonuclease, N-terminal resolvase-like domain/T4 RNase H, C terminal
MIIVDFSGTIVAAIMANVYLNPDEPVNEERIRWSVLSSLRNYNTKFKAEYGKLIVACDGQNYWRKEIFPYYKVKRKLDRDASSFDWTHIFGIIKRIREEIKKFLPYPVIEVERAEGDDVIATLVEMDSTFKDKVLIISRDKDLKQLQKYPWVKQWNPVDKRWEVAENPKEFLAEHILIGDVGDSIPNVYSAENSIALGIRQSAATAKRKALGKAGALSPERYELNEKLVDLSFIPSDVTWEILAEYEKQINKPKGKLLFYLMSHGLDQLAASIQDF